MGSSNGGGGEKGAAGKADSPAEADDTNAAAGVSSAAPDTLTGQPSYAEGEKVLAFHGPRIYEAKVQKVEYRDNEWKYYVHYLGWNKNWDEWVENDRLLEFNEENVEKQKVLEKNLGAEKNQKSGRSGLSKPKGSHEAKWEKEDPKNNSIRGKKRKGQTGAEEDMKPSERLTMIQLPLTLKKQLVDDWEFVAQLGLLIQWGRFLRASVATLIRHYLPCFCTKMSVHNIMKQLVIKCLRQLFMVLNIYFAYLMSPKGQTQDIGWEHGTMVNKNRMHFKCNYCGHERKGGGVSLLKKHLAGGKKIGYKDVVSYPSVPSAVRLMMAKHLQEVAKETQSKKKQFQQHRHSVSGYAHDIRRNDDEDWDDDEDADLQKALQRSCVEAWEED